MLHKLRETAGLTPHSEELCVYVLCACVATESEFERKTLLVERMRAHALLNLPVATESQQQQPSSPPLLRKSVYRQKMTELRVRNSMRHLAPERRSDHWTAFLFTERDVSIAPSPAAAHCCSQRSICTKERDAGTETREQKYFSIILIPSLRVGSQVVQRNKLCLVAFSGLRALTDASKEQGFRFQRVTTVYQNITTATL